MILDRETLDPWLASKELWELYSDHWLLSIPAPSPSYLFSHFQAIDLLLYGNTLKTELGDKVYALFGPEVLHLPFPLLRDLIVNHQVRRSGPLVWSILVGDEFAGALLW